jgi:hypothetical protein
LRKLLLPTSGQVSRPIVEERGTYIERMRAGTEFQSKEIEERRTKSRIFDP